MDRACLYVSLVEVVSPVKLAEVFPYRARLQFLLPSFDGNEFVFLLTLSISISSPTLVKIPIISIKQQTIRIIEMKGECRVVLMGKGSWIMLVLMKLCCWDNLT